MFYYHVFSLSFFFILNCDLFHLHFFQFVKKANNGYWKWFAGNLASGGAAGASSLIYLMDTENMYFDLFVAN